MPSGRFGEEGDKGRVLLLTRSPSCIDGVPGNEGWEEMYWMDILFAHGSLREKGREGLPRRGSLGLRLLFLILALSCPCFPPPSYRVDNREEQQDESFPSLRYA